MKTRKKYTKPLLSSANGGPHFVPALAVGAALAGGYVAGRAVKSALGRSEDNLHMALRKVTA